MAAKAKTAKKDPKKEMTKSEIVTTLAEKTGLTKSDIGNVFDELSALIAKNLGRRGPGSFTVPGLMKIEVKKKPATKARKGRNPFTGEEITIKAKPATNVVRVRPLKGLKDMA